MKIQHLIVFFLVSCSGGGLKLKSKQGNTCEGINKPHALGYSTPRRWMEQNLAAIRIDYPAPTVHARNMYHLAIALYDIWAAFDATAKGYLFKDKKQADNINRARSEAMSYAAFRILNHRYQNSPGKDTTLARIADELESQNFIAKCTVTATENWQNFGNQIADLVLGYGLFDGANELNNYADLSGYNPVNPAMVLSSDWYFQFISNPVPTQVFQDANRWQPLAFSHLVLQNGIIVGAATQEFLSPNWQAVSPFALTRASTNDVYLDPGAPPYLNGVGNSQFRNEIIEVIQLSSKVDPAQTSTIDISPRSMGNNTLGSNDGAGYGNADNPITGQPYTAQLVPEADFGRVLAEFWADGPDSETPPGHWVSLSNYVSDHSLATHQFEGSGPPLDRTEWDVKLYLAITSAVHDAAIAAWNAKSSYDYVRPITSIRRMGALGQSSNAAGPYYHADGLPIITGLTEIITSTTRSTTLAAAGFTGADDGRMAIRAWAGEPPDTETDVGGVTWIRADKWFPYQRSTFVTPPFAGYVSGHSTFSRAGAEVLTLFTGSPYFPGGLGTFTAEQDTFLAFEKGPSQTIVLQWAKYYDAADQAGYSRLWGGIHVSADDLKGRIMGSAAGIAAFNKAKTYFDGTAI